MILISSDSCAPCKTVKDYVFKSDVSYVEILNIDVHEEALDLMAKYGSKTVPTLVDLENDACYTGATEIMKVLKAENDS